MKHQTKIRPDTKQLINLSQINQAIFPLRIDAQGLADYGFLPTTTYMGPNTTCRKSCQTCAAPWRWARCGPKGKR